MVDPKVISELETIAGPVVSEDPGEGPRPIAGRYEILSLLGQGGMGAVYRARDTELDEIVALKVLRRELVARPDMLERFRREVKLARRVTHKNVARTFDIGEHEGEKFLTMELIEGETLGRLLDRSPDLSDQRRLEIALGIAEGLAAAHEAGVVHRDLKPDNVLVTPTGRVVITDFGIARTAFDVMAETQHSVGGIVGTPAFMAPEQVEGARDIEARADIYAFGVILFGMLTGELPWKRDTPMAGMIARLQEPPPDPRILRPDLPLELSQVVLTCLARLPADRYANAGGLLAALRPHVKLGSARPRPPSVRPSPPPAAPVSTTASGMRAVAVLPFTVSGAADADELYVADGLAEEMIDTLSMAPGLKVRPWSVVRALRAEAGAGADPRALGAKLGVEALVIGALRRLGPRVRVSTRLVSVADGFQLWAKRGEHAPDEVLALGDALAADVACALALELGAEPRQRSASPAAVDLYLRARHEYRGSDPVRVMRAVELFEQAAALAPDDPAILTGLAMARARLWFFGGEGSEERARAAADKAIAQSPGRGEPYLARAAVKLHAGQAKEALLDVREALARSPGLAEAHELKGRILAESGPIEEAVHHCRVALSLDPGLFDAEATITRMHALRGEWDQAHAFLDKDQEPARGLQHWMMRVRFSSWERDPARIRRYLEHPEIRSGQYPVARMVLEAIAGNAPPIDPHDVFGPRVAHADASPRGRSFFLQLNTEIAASRDQPDLAMERLRQLIETTEFMDIVWLDRCPTLASTRAHPDYPVLRAVVAARAAEVSAVR